MRISPFVSSVRTCFMNEGSVIGNSRASSPTLVGPVAEPPDHGAAGRVRERDEHAVELRRILCHAAKCCPANT